MGKKGEMWNRPTYRPGLKTQSILLSSTESYFLLISLHVNQTERLQLKLFSVPTPPNFSTLSSLFCICYFFSSHTSSLSFLSVVRSFPCKTSLASCLPTSYSPSAQSQQLLPPWKYQFSDPSQECYLIPSAFRHPLLLPCVPIHWLC